MPWWWQRLLIVACALSIATPVASQENSAWPERAYVTVDVPFQLLNNNFSEALTFADTIRKTETAHFGAGYGSTRGPLLDVGTGVRVIRQIGAGVTLSLLRRSVDGAFDLVVPSLIAGNAPLDLRGSVPGLERTDLIIHLDALYPVTLRRKFRLMLSSGPSILRAKQDLVRSIEFDTLPGLTTLTFDQAFVTHATKTAIGFNVGADVTWNFATHLGVGTVTRYSRANVTLDPGSAPGISRSVALQVGGLYVSGGIRLRF